MTSLTGNTLNPLWRGQRESSVAKAASPRLPEANYMSRIRFMRYKRKELNRPSVIEVAYFGANALKHNAKK